MKLILLAAGKSSRIYKKIKKNKCLINIDNKSLIRNIIDNAKSVSLKNITVVTGFKPSNIIRDLKNYKKISYIYNSKYKTTDMVYSSMLALKKTNEDVIISYTDIFYEKEVFKNLIDLNKKTLTLPYILNWKDIWKSRKKNIFDDAETFLINSRSSIKEIGNKITKKNIKKINGQFMGIIFIPKKLIKTVVNFYENNDCNKLQFTSFLNKLLNNNINITGLKYDKFWYEIDDIIDLKNFHKFYKQSSKRRKSI
ncbi:NTP transferase domain-containing protein [Candidatus Pelagibacter sp.]|nr:NTP transferase domain-containing protein [Candidatus Pelagibacter sp.]